MHKASTLLFRAADSCGMGGVDVSAPGSSSAAVSGLVPGAGQSSPGFSLPSRLCPGLRFRTAGGSDFRGGLNFRVPHSSQFLVAQTSVCGVPLQPHGWRTSQDQSETHKLKSMLPASGKGKIEDRKTRTLEHHKDAPPVRSKSFKGWATRQLKRSHSCPLRLERRASVILCRMLPFPA
jgi:hypothetical protein